MRNNFPDSVFDFWTTNHLYSFSGKSGLISLHHILKRNVIGATSIFNSIPLTSKEHEAGDIHSLENRIKFLTWTRSYVYGKLEEDLRAYEIRETDRLFLVMLKTKYGI
jgi:hypothetical protein